MSVELAHLVLVMLASILGASSLLKAAQIFVSSQTGIASSAIDEGGLVFLFEGRRLVDASASAKRLIAPFLSRMSDFDAMLHVLSPIFPQICTAVCNCQNTTLNEVNGDNRNLSARIAPLGNKTKLTVDRSDQITKSSVTNFIEDDVRLAELEMLRELAKQAPQLIWQEDQKGNVTWSNQAYLAFSDSNQDQPTGIPSWPRSSIFPAQNTQTKRNQSVTQRLSAKNNSTKPEHWFDVVSVLQGKGSLHFATDANAIVRAEQDRRNFVQTVGKTFAQLSIGLAIFDKRRQLAMFNPALLDLTGLSAEFLSSRPTVDAILDKLREAKVLPEPKNYRSWREEFMAFETEAKDGTYCEIWNLPEGQSYRVTGRPHPDGAFAILFEDVSSEVTLTRRFRSDLETSQAVLDTIAEPIAVFSSSGILVMSNLAYSDLWALEDTNQLMQRDIRSESQIWQERCSPTLMWSDLISFTHRSKDKKLWSKHAILMDGRHISCQATPIANAMTMVRFSFDRSVSSLLGNIAVVNTRQKNSKA